MDELNRLAETIAERDECYRAINGNLRDWDDDCDYSYEDWNDDPDDWADFESNYSTIEDYDSQWGWN